MKTMNSLSIQLKKIIQAPGVYYLGAFVLICVIIIFKYNSSDPKQTHLIQRNITLASENNQLKMQLLDLKSQVLMLQTSKQLSQQLLDRTLQTNTLLKRQLYQQQQDLKAYKLALNKKAKQVGPVVRDMVIQAGSQPNHYRYKLVLINTDQTKKNIDGAIKLSVAAMSLKTGKLEYLPWRDVSSDPDYQDKIFFSFSQVALIPGHMGFAELVLPEGFIALFVSVEIYMDKHKEPVEQQVFNWPD